MRKRARPLRLKPEPRLKRTHPPPKLAARKVKLLKRRREAADSGKQSKDG